MTSGGTGPGAADMSLLRCYEPVLRFTRGELFLPMPVEAYLETCSLWRSAERGRASGRPASSQKLCAPGELTPAALARAGAGSAGGRPMAAVRPEPARPP
jgi:hypothetical protein